MIFQAVIQGMSLKTSKSGFLQISFYIFLAFICALYNSSIHTEITVNDAKKPINSLKDFLRPEYKETRPMLLSFTRTNVKSVNGNYEYGRVVKKAFAMNISFIENFMNDRRGYIARSLNLTYEGKVVFITISPLIIALKKMGCSNLRGRTYEDQIIAWVTAEEFNTNPKIGLMNRRTSAKKRHIIEQS